MDKRRWPVTPDIGKPAARPPNKHIVLRQPTRAYQFDGADAPANRMTQGADLTRAVQAEAELGRLILALN
jgi:hypothetical protein